VLDCFILRLSDARLGHVDLELVVSQGIVVEHGDGHVGLRLRGHGDESEAPRFARALVRGDIHRGDRSGGCEQGVDFVLRGGLVQIPYVNSYIHWFTAFYPKGHMSGNAGIKWPPTL